jgi:plastocyanin
MMRFNQTLIIPLLILVIVIGVFSYSPAYATNTDVKIASGSSVPGCEVYNNCFIPSTVTINTGDQVTWYNTDSAAHTVTSGTNPDGPDGNFDSSLFMAGTTFSVKFDNYAAGTYSYICMVHPWMTGKVIVKENLTVSSITVSTDKRSYKSGDRIKIFGEVGTLLSGIPVSLQVFASNGNLVVIEQGDVSYDKKFSFVLDNTNDPVWSSSGTYTVKVLYGTQSRTAETTFSFTKSSTPPTPIPTSKSDITIAYGSSVPGCEQTNSCYSPPTFRVGRGSTVTWYNADTAAHTVTSGTAKNGPDGEFDSNIFLSGITFSAKFDREGTYPYFCMLHPWMTGYVIVERGGTVSTPTPTPIPTPRDTIAPKILQPTDIEVDAEDQNGARVTYEVLAIDDTDQLVRPSCSPSSGSFFAVGDTRVNCSAMDKSGNRAQQVSFTVTVNPIGVVIPSWVKNVASFWCDDKIDDSSFVEGVQYLIDNDIIHVSGTSSGFGSSQSIPSWIKNNACWWSAGQIADADFASGLEYLISQGILRV